MTTKQAKLLRPYLKWDQPMPIAEKEAAPLIEAGWMVKHSDCAWAYTIYASVTREGHRAYADLRVGGVPT